MARYSVVGEWSEERAAQVGRQRFSLQSADVKDTLSGHVYQQDAYRVCVGPHGQDNPKPFKQGKGGTVPFKGESAWSDGERLFDDLVSAARFAR